MKLLFDANLSPRLVNQLKDVYPNATHVRDHGLAQADDDKVWGFAQCEDWIIVSKDADFHQRSLLYGFPPKVIWVRVGNCSTTHIANLLRNFHSNLQRFAADEEAAFLIIS